MTLEQFKAKVDPSNQVRDSLLTVRSQRLDAQTQRALTMRKALALCSWS